MKNTYINILTFALLLSFGSSLISCGEQVSTPTTSEQPIKTAWTGKAYSGPLAPKMYLGNINDFYIESLDGDVHIKVTQDEWKQITNIDSFPYTYNLWTLDINYEGYFTVDFDKTDVLVKDHLKDGVIENTLELREDNASMNKIVDAKNQIILMGNYKTHSKLTQYNELIVEEISLYTDGIGALEFGTLNLKTRDYTRKYLTTVSKGLNTIKLNTYVGYNETLVIGGGNSNISLYTCAGIDDDNEYGLFSLNKNTLNIESDRLILKVKAKSESYTLDRHLENLTNIETSYLFKGKNISIFGDSISSFKGYSNDTSKNSTIGNNGTHYSGSNCGVTDVNQTWWMRLVNKTETNLIVNNSSAGDAMNGQGLNRCVQLHNNEGVNPDIICMFFGINDIWRATGTLEMFKTNYVKMLNKMIEKYPSAVIYASTYLPYTWWTGTDKETVYHKTESELEPYNTFVRETISNTENVYLVDLARDSGITFDNYKSYCADEGNRWLHPNAAGMELISDTYYNAMMNR